MLFHSAEFLLFFVTVTVACFAMPFRYRWLLLLIASYAFYMAWRPEYLLLILASTAVDYTAGRALGREAGAQRRRLWLALSVTVNLGLLFTFKYFNFFAGSAAALFSALGMEYMAPHLTVLLPVGISFYTFQTLGYTFDVYAGRQTPERHFGRFALFVAFFPQLVAGPIERARRLLPQFTVRHTFDYSRVRSGLTLMLWGFFKKIVIADRLALVVDFVYANPERHPGSFLALATVFFAFQIYCDFSGYTDIARGAARILGIELMHNFNRPYAARSIADFWRRWHISLTTWFRDYLYYPLGGNRVQRVRWMTNIAIVFLVSGLWHGAAWTFVIWGALHAAFYLTGRATANLRQHLYTSLKLNLIPWLTTPMAVTMTFVLVSFAWIFFRAENLDTARYILTHLHHGWFDLTPYGGWREIILSMDLSPRAVALSAGLIAVLLAAEHHFGDREIDGYLAQKPWWIRWPVYGTLVLAIVNLGVLQEIPFVYYQF